MKLELYRRTFKKNSQILNFTKIRPVGAGLFHADGQGDRQTDMTKLIVCFRNFANAPKTPSFPSLLIPMMISHDAINIKQLIHQVTHVIKRQLQELSTAAKRVTKITFFREKKIHFSNNFEVFLTILRIGQT